MRGGEKMKTIGGILFLIALIMLIPAATTTASAARTTSSDEEYCYSDGNDWTNFDGDGQFTECDVDMMCDENYVDEDEKDEKACKATYEEIEEVYGYKTKENEHENEDDRE